MTESALSPMLTDLLQVAAGERGDKAGWHRLVLATCECYDDAQRARGFQELIDRRLITSEGAPAAGWLTLRGHQVFVELTARAMVAAPPVPQPADGVTFAEYDREARRSYWGAVLRTTRGNVRQAAMLAGCARTTVIQQLRRLDLRARDFSA